MWNILTIILLLAILNKVTAADYEYEFLDVHINSSDTEKINAHVEVVRISRGIYGLSGTINFNIPVTDEFTIKTEVYRSTSGTGEWYKLPYAYPKSSAIKCFDIMYRKIVMDSLKKCSTLPQLERGWKGPFPAGSYKVNECQIKTDKLPSYLPDGYYKVKALMEGPVTVYFEIFVKLENKFKIF